MSASVPPVKWTALRLQVIVAVLFVYASYWFVMEPPQAHAFYVLSPIAFMLAAFWWMGFVDSPRARRIAAAVLILNIAVHAGLAVAEGPELSLYKNREVVATALRLKSPEMFAHRRDFAVDGGPAVLSDLSRGYDPTRDFQVLESAYREGPRHSLHWTVTVRTAARSSPSGIRCTLDLLRRARRRRRRTPNGSRTSSSPASPERST
jgi:hypothetical protein